MLHVPYYPFAVHDLIWHHSCFSVTQLHLFIVKFTHVLKFSNVTESFKDMKIMESISTMATMTKTAFAIVDFA